MNQTSFTLYQKKKERLKNEFKLALSKNLKIGLAKKTSNLFRNRQQTNTCKINVRNFNQVISIDSHKMIGEVEGMTTYEDFVKVTLEYGLMPAVVPELKSITVGGAATGIGIESSSFKYGLVHETVLEMEILLSDGSTVIASPTNENKDLFFGFPNSYGTLGYALKLKIKLVPVKQYVWITHSLYTDRKQFYKDLEKICLEGRKDGSVDFVDGTIFDENNLYITLGKFVDEVPYTGNYKYMGIYYKSISRRKTDYLTVSDYIWRWDPDWFWGSRAFYMQNRVVRFLLGKFALKSTFYWRIKKFYDSTKFFNWHKHKNYEPIIQDVAIPIENCEKFLDFFQKEIGIKPVWNCPVMAYNLNAKYDLFSFDPKKLYINFGFWEGKISNKEPGYYNRLIEQKVKEFLGRKSLYSDSYYSPEEFWQIYNKPVYDRLKSKYDHSKIFRDLYEKCVRRK